ncbi:TRAFAC clade GTPase domain-containing protein [Parachitinimonas caeni]|uniref:Double-GTPase 2 domain-containing protein n=1 Tax=Parachitinimonas caeni TaxID=3031301 RepID=A0ABT7E1P3_9NEIS|nr:hypothetical protein [Parachitinimonas caeni]MDK2126226.1 hypothetical protein [Parachitinimonas caeni]
METRQIADEDIDVFDSSSNEQPVDAEQPWVTLSASGMLTVEDADGLLRWRPVSIIAIVGERNGGKTTLITEIYQQFLRAPFAGHLFCHSLSLQGFERKCYQSRTISGNLYPDTPRTSVQEGLSFFHLAVSSQSVLQRTDLLIAERAGESYKKVRDNSSLATDMLELCKASTIVFIVDGEKVADFRQRGEVFASTRHLIRALVETETISPVTQIQLVTTKWDLLEGDGAMGARSALANFEKGLATAYPTIKVFHTAARDPSGHISPSTSLEPLFQSWLVKPLPAQAKPITIPPLRDEFDLLLLRRNAS